MIFVLKVCLLSCSNGLGARSQKSYTWADGQQPMFINSIRLKTEGQVSLREEGLRNLHNSKKKLTWGTLACLWSNLRKHLSLSCYLNMRTREFLVSVFPNQLLPECFLRIVASPGSTLARLPRVLLINYLPTNLINYPTTVYYEIWTWIEKDTYLLGIPENIIFLKLIFKCFIFLMIIKVLDFSLCILLLFHFL